MGYYWNVKRAQPLIKGQSYVFVANHTSMTDIMLMLVTFKNHPFVFIGKKELVKILDQLGRETSFKPNTPLIYVYSDGSTEKIFTIGE